MANKYHAKRCYWDVENERLAWSIADVEAVKAKMGKQYTKKYIPFDSMFEMDVYQELIKVHPHHLITRQHSVEIFPKSICFPNGKSWRCDFAVLSANEPRRVVRYVEAKGVITRDFANILGLVELNNPDCFHKLDIIFSHRPANNQVIERLMKCPVGATIYSLGDYQRQLQKEFEVKYG